MSTEPGMCDGARAKAFDEVPESKLRGNDLNPYAASIPGGRSPWSSDDAAAGAPLGAQCGNARSVVDASPGGAKVAAERLCVSVDSSLLRSVRLGGAVP